MDAASPNCLGVLEGFDVAASRHTHVERDAMSLLNAVEPKDPGESKYYTMDWTAELNSGATISGSTWVVTGLTNVTDGIVTGSLKTTIKLSGGIDGQDYACTNTVTTSDGETLVQTGVVRVRYSTSP